MRIKEMKLEGVVVNKQYFNGINTNLLSLK